MKQNDNQVSTPEKNERQSSNWDIKNAPRNYLTLIIFQIAGSFFAFASVWLITKTIGSEGYGGVVAIIAASQIAQVFVNWTAFSLIKFGTEEFVEAEKISRIFWIRFFVLIPNLLLVLAASRLWFEPLAEWLKLSTATFYFVILHFLTTTLWIHVQYSLQSVKMQRLQGGLLTVERLLIFGGLVFLWYVGSLHPRSAILFYALSPLLMSLVGVWFLRKYIFKSFSPNKKFLREVLAYSLPLLPFSVVGYFSGGYVDAVFIAGFLSTKDLGIYSVASQINGIFLQVPTLANSLLIPFFVTLQSEKRTNLLHKYFRHLFPALILLGGFGAMTAAFVCYFLVPTMFGEEFSASVLPLWILLAASVISLPALVGYAALIHSSGLTYIATISSIISAAVNISANFILIPRYGMAGCAWATVITFFAGVAVFAIFLKKNLKISFSWTFAAIFPVLLSGIIYSYFLNPWTALIVGIISTIITLFVYSDSIKNSIEIARKIRNS